MTNHMTPNKEAAQALKDCPFCGGKAYQIETTYTENRRTVNKQWAVGCSKCHISFDMHVSFKDQAVEKWNTRAEALTAHGKAEGEHPDDIAVDKFAAAMKAKLAEKRDEGRGGWESPECSEEYLQILISEHIQKGDPVDVGNIAMMLFNRGERTDLVSSPVSINCDRRYFPNAGKPVWKKPKKASHTPQTVEADALKHDVCQILNEARCLEKRTVGNYELTNRIFDHLTSRGLLGRVAEWRDISTAPKDGTNILAFYKENHGDSIVIAHFDEATWAWWTDGGLDLYAVHGVDTPSEWMPLPASPQPKPQNEKG